LFTILVRLHTKIQVVLVIVKEEEQPEGQYEDRVDEGEE
jgi:hypothetical protein